MTHTIPIILTRVEVMMDDPNIDCQCMSGMIDFQSWLRDLRWFHKLPGHSGSLLAVKPVVYLWAKLS